MRDSFLLPSSRAPSRSAATVLRPRRGGQSYRPSIANAASPDRPFDGRCDTEITLVPPLPGDPPTSCECTSSMCASSSTLVAPLLLPNNS